MSVFRKLFDKRKYRRVVMLCVTIFGLYTSLIGQDRIALSARVDSLFRAGSYKEILKVADIIGQSDSVFYQMQGMRYKGIAYDLLGKDSLALSWLRGAATMPLTYSEPYGDLGRFYLDRQMYDSALVNYNKALNHIHDHHQETYIGGIFLDAAIALKLKKDYPMALTVLDQSMAYLKSDWKPYYHKADVFHSVNAFDSALYYVELAEGLNGAENAPLTYIKASANFYSGNTSTAIRLAESIAKDPDMGYTATFLLGDIYRETGEREKSLECYKKCLIMYPDDLLALNNLGFINVELDDCAAAVPYLDRAIELYPDFAFSYNNKATCRYKKGLHYEALTLVDKSLSLDDQNAWAYANRAKIYFALGQSNKACKDVVTAEQLKYPEQEDLALLKSKCR